MKPGYAFDPSILREYDVRGIVGQTLNPSDAEALGRAFGTIVRRKFESQSRVRVCVGYDGRLSSPTLCDALVAGLTASGADVTCIGIGPTPMLYFAVHHLEADGGIMITGSHNPPDYNGFKMMLGREAFFGERIQALGEIARQGAFASGAGEREDADVLDAYVARLSAQSSKIAPLKIAWDTGNGAAGEAVQRLVARLPGEHTVLNGTIDGTFPAHHPDPTVAENLEQLIEAVARDGCDLGVAFDGDGDRIGVVDEDGEVLWSDQILALLARDVLRERPGATIIADVKASQTFFDEIARLGGEPLMWITGHSVIKAKMAEIGAPLAGEMSGHIFFADRYYGYDDALYAAVRLLELISHEKRSLGRLRRDLPPAVNTPELRFDCPDARKFEVVKEVSARLADSGADVTDIDGVRVRTGDGWWLLRASNTQPVLVARCEAHDDGGLERLKSALVEQLEASGITPPQF